MINDVQNSIISTLQTSVSGLNLVKQYANEFAPGAEWIPVFPCALVRLTEAETKLSSADGKALRIEGEINIYTAAKNNSSPGSLSLASDIFSALDGLVSVLGENEDKYVHFSSASIKFFDTEYGTTVHVVTINFRL